MSSAEMVPAELWLIIFDSVIQSTIEPHNECSYLTFPEVLQPMRKPWEYRNRDPESVRNLRLVCRLFNRLLQYSPYFFMSKKGVQVPAGTRALFIAAGRYLHALFLQLLEEPSRCRQIVVLDLPGRESRPNPNNAFLFDVLCDNARYLPAVRSLTLGLRDTSSISSPTPRFWGRLNDAFPYLTCLVLRGVLKTVTEEAPINFRYLRILDVDQAYPDSMLYFPALRHAAMGGVSWRKIRQVEGWSRLESLLLREIRIGTVGCNWNMLPDLRLIGIPHARLDSLARLPPGHPLQHIYVYVGTRPKTDYNSHPFRRQEEMRWLTSIIERLPTITRITLAFEKPENHRTSSIIGDFDADELSLKDFTIGDPDSTIHGTGLCLILERVPHVSPIQAPPDATTSQRKGFLSILRLFASRIFRR